MKCISKRIFSVLLAAALILPLAACAEEPDQNAYQVYETSYQFGITNIAKNDALSIRSNAFFANFGVNF